MFRKMLITGAGGMVGRQAADYFSKEYAVTVLNKAALSITEQEAVKQIFQIVKPDIILNYGVIRNDRCYKTNSLPGESMRRRYETLPYVAVNAAPCLYSY